ncbi:MAG: DUF6876 family protein [Nitrososphaeraceae archaeon]
MSFDPDKRYVFNYFALNYIATAGVMETFEEQACYWVGDVIASYKQTLIDKNADYLKVVEVVLKDGGCVFTITDEINGELVRQDIPFTTLKENVKLWLITEGEHEVVMLPSEY